MHICIKLMDGVQENCWFFCAVCLEALFDGFNGTFTIGKLHHTGLLAAPEVRAAVYSQLPILVSFSMSLFQNAKKKHSDLGRR